MSHKNYLFIVYLFYIFTTVSTGLEVCEDHYIHCPQDDCGAYPLQPLYRYHCMKTCGVCTNMNRALGKPTAQITTKNGGVSGRAVDGNINNDLTGNTCTKTNETGLNDQWWCVDLQTVYNIDTIKIYNIHDKNQKNLLGFKVSFGLDGACDDEGFRKSTICFTDLAWKIESVYSINQCNNDSPIHLVGRFVFISTTRSLVSTQPIPLSLCEVGVHTGTKCNSGYFSYNKTTCQPCNTCVESSCDAETGVCLEGCINGYRGVKCDECIPGRFGPSCRYACNDTKCVGNCDSETGTCHLCKHGYYGRNCEQTCDDKCIGGECIQLDGSCALEKDREPENTFPYPTLDNEGINKTGVGFVGVVCGIIITCLALLVYRVFKKRRNRKEQKPILMTPKPVRPPPIPEDNSTYIPSFESISSRYIQVTDSDPVTDELGYLASREVPDSIRSDVQKNEGPRRESSYSLDRGSRFNVDSDRTRKVSVYSLNVDNGYESAQTSRRYSSSGVENRPPLQLPGVNKEGDKRESKELYQDEGYDPYEHVTNI